MPPLSKLAPLLACIACLVAAGCASGQRGPGGTRAAGGASEPTLRPAGLLLASFDADGDYRVTRQEIAEGTRQAFAQADSNGDGVVSLVELGEWRARALGARDALPGAFAFDADQDRVVTPAEFAAAIANAAESYMDEDGTIPFSALIRPATDRFDRRGEDRFRDDPRGGPDRF